MTRKEAIGAIIDINQVEFGGRLEPLNMAIEALELVTSYEGTINKLTEALNQQKEGHWILVSDGYGDNVYICECSACKDTVWVLRTDKKYNYCPNCGAHMKGGE